jgi:hypothetical protein
MGASWRARQTLLLPFLKNPRKISIFSIAVSCRAHTKGERRRKEERKDDADGDASFMRGTISPVASNPKRRKRGKGEEAMDDCEEQAVHVMRITPSPGSPNLPCWKTMRAPAALAAAETWQNGGSKCAAAVLFE